MNEDKLKDGLKTLEILLRKINEKIRIRRMTADEVSPTENASTENALSDVVVTLHSPNHILHLKQETGVLYAQCLENLNAAIGGKGIPKLSFTHLEERVKAAIFEVVSQSNLPEAGFEERLASVVEGLRGALQQAPRPWLVTQRIHGIKDNGLPLRFGRVDFVAGDENRLAELHNLVNETPEDADLRWGDGRTQLQRWHDELDVEFRNNVLAQVAVEAVDSVAAREVAFSEIRRTLDIMNYFATQIPFLSGCWARLPGDAGAETMLLVLQPQAGCAKPKHKRQSAASKIQTEDPAQQSHDATATASCEFYLAPAGVFAPFGIAALPLISHDFNLGWEIMDSILANLNRSAEEERVLTACAWAGRASTPRRAEESFLFYAVALETLLLGGLYHDSLSYRFKLRAAWLMGRDAAARKALFKKMSTLYSSRSTIVHHGKLTVTGIELGEIRILTLTALNRVLSTPQAWRPQADKPSRKSEESLLDQWIEGKILGDEEHSIT